MNLRPRLGFVRIVGDDAVTTTVEASVTVTIGDEDAVGDL